MGFLTPHPIPGPTIMVVRLGQTAADVRPRCLTLENIHIAYLGLLPDTEEEDYWNHIAAAGISSSRCVYTMFTPAIDEDYGQEVMDAIESQTSIVGVQPSELEEIRRRGNTVEVESPVLGGTRTLALDLDVLFRALEEEIALDEHNIRGFRIV
ncbi:hypothetical protein C8R47DRAFT_1224314 [Mycena vitilis]|nr:hypothetical protein C8R47DRAFT_1224314 [Mycena vitilis]